MVVEDGKRILKTFIFTLRLPTKMAIEAIADEAQIRSSARTFLDAGKDKFRADKFEDAKFYLGLAGRLFRKLSDEWNVGIVRGWYASTIKRLEIEEQPAWYYAPSK